MCITIFLKNSYLHFLNCKLCMLPSKSIWHMYIYVYTQSQSKRSLHLSELNFWIFFPLWVTLYIYIVFIFKISKLFFFWWRKFKGASKEEKTIKTKVHRSSDISILPTSCTPAPYSFHYSLFYHFFIYAISISFFLQYHNIYI